LVLLELAVQFSNFVVLSADHVAQFANYISLIANHLQELLKWRGPSFDLATASIPAR
jgi:hypothetical protein